MCCSVNGWDSIKSPLLGWTDRLSLREQEFSLLGLKDGECVSDCIFLFTEDALTDCLSFILLVRPSFCWSICLLVCPSFRFCFHLWDFTHARLESHAPWSFSVFQRGKWPPHCLLICPGETSKLHTYSFLILANPWEGRKQKSVIDIHWKPCLHV